MDDVEEGREPVDLVELARQRRREVEAKAVDVAVGDEVAKRVHDQPQHRGMHRVERVARARVVHVVARVARNGPVVGEVVDALEREHRPKVVPLRGVVVDDVEDHLDPGAVQRLDHPLELLHLLAAPAGRRVERVRGEVADRAVAPVVGQSLGGEVHLVGDVVDRQQLDRGDAEGREVLERRLGGEAGVGASQLLGNPLHQLREALHVQLVDDGLVPRTRRRTIFLPVERIVGHDRLRDRGRVVLVVPLEIGVLAAGNVGEDVPVAPEDRALDRLRVRVDQQLGGVEAVTLLGRPGTVDAVAVALPGPDPRQVAVPVERRALRQLVAGLAIVLVEEAELDLLGVLGEEREVRALAVPPRAKRKQLPRPDPHASGRLSLPPGEAGLRERLTALSKFTRGARPSRWRGPRAASRARA